MSKKWGKKKLLKAAPGDSGDLMLHAAAEPAELLFEALAAGDEKKLPTFSMAAYNGGPMFPGGWYEASPIIIDLAGMEVSQTIPIDSDHVRDVGHTTAIDKTTKSLRAKGVLSAYSTDDDDDEAIEAKRIVRMGSNQFPFQASITPAVLRSKIEFHAEGSTVEVNGRKFKGPVYVARQSILKKIAILSLGADATTQTTIAAQPGSTTMNPEFLAWLKANDLPEAPTGKLLLKLEAQYNAEKTPAVIPPVVTPPADPTVTIRAAAAAEEKRQSDIRLICKANPDLLTASDIDKTVKEPILQLAIRAGWDAEKTRDRFELEAERASRPAPNVITGHGHEQDCTVNVLAASLLLRAGQRLDNPAFARPETIGLVPDWLRGSVNADSRQKIMEAAWKFRDLAMIDLCREAIRIDGKSVPHSRDKIIEAAFSGMSLTNIFTTNMNTVILAGYTEAGDTTGAWTRTVDVADFKTNERPRLTKGAGLALLPRGGEADHMTRGDVMESYKIARYAGQIQVDEQDVIDDTFQAFNDFAPEMGRAALRLRPDLVYSILMSNPTLSATARELFNATDGNLNTTATLTATTLKAAISDMRLFRENSVNLNIEPTHFVGPPTLAFTIAELLQSASIVVTTTADLTRGDKNVLQGVVQPITDARLENGVTSPATGTAYSGSASTWYLASTQVNTIEVAYLRGTGRAPQVRSKVLDGGKYGMQWDIALDIGAKAMDWRGLHKNTA